MAAEIDRLNQNIQNLQGEKNALLIQMQQKQHEIHNLQNMLTESMTTAEKNQRLIKVTKDLVIKETKDYANKEHDRLITQKNNEHNKLIMSEKNNEMQNIIQKWEN